MINKDNPKEAPDLTKHQDLIKINDSKYYKLSALGKNWVTDMLICICLLKKEEFTTEDVYVFKPFFEKRYPNNNTIEAKIRQQLQFLEYNGLLIMVNKKGLYRKNF